MDLSYWLRRSAEKYPNNIASVAGRESISYAKLNERVNRLANGLLGLGLKKGDRIGHVQNNSPQCLEVDFAIYRCGLIKVSMSPRLSAKEYLYLMEDSEANGLIYGEEFAEAINEIKGNLKDLKYIIQVSGDNKGVINYEKLIKSASSAYPKIDVDIDDICTLQYSSGTTGKPKAAIYPHRTWLISANNFMIEDEEAFNQEDVVLHVAPISHASQLFMFPCIFKGGKNILLRRFNVEEFLETIEREKVTRIFLVPTQIKMILEFENLEKYNLDSLKSIYYAAAPIDKFTLKNAMERIGEVFVQFYGLTEAPGPLTYFSRRDHAIEAGKKGFERLNSAGRAISSLEMKIVDETKKELNPGENGEIILRSEHMMKGYWKDRKKTDETIINGWLHSGDIGRFDEDGYLFIVDRRTDMLISGGFNVYPKEIEDVLYGHPAILEVAVIGIPDKKWGEVVHAEIVLKQGMPATKEDIVEFCKNNLAGYKKPQSVNFVEALPKNPTGKILKKEIKEKYWKGYDRRVA